MMQRLVLSLFAVAALSAAPNTQTFTGTITEDQCPKADHSVMAMDPTPSACAIACVSAHGSAYVLYDGENVYTLSDQQIPEKFAAQKVTVTGTLDANTRTIQVDSITAAK